MIIHSLLDTDLYKYTMMQLVLHHFPEAQVEYRFKLRRSNVDLTPLIPELEREISALCELQLADDELAYLASLPYIKADFIALLRGFKLDEQYIGLKGAKHENGGFELIIRGPWLHTILFEVPLLAIISETYFKYTVPNEDLAEGRRRLHDKIAYLKQHVDTKQFRLTDFGTRRRFARDWQTEVVNTLKAKLPDCFVGTSNVHLAQTLDLTPIGTMAHEYVQAFQALAGDVLHSQQKAFEVWEEEYRGQLGIALSDTISLQQFLKDFDLGLAKSYDGARQDSGDPIAWAEAVIAHYEKLGLDPKTKTLVFSDSLDMQRAIAIHQHVIKKSNPMFGIGTYLTNDVGHKPLDMVIKMVECNGQPVAKLSDAPGKTMCMDRNYLAYLNKLFV